MPEPLSETSALTNQKPGKLDTELMKNRRKYNKTSVGCVKLGKILNLSTRLSLGYFENLLPASKGLKGVPNFFDHLIFVSKPYIPILKRLPI